MANIPSPEDLGLTQVSPEDLGLSPVPQSMGRNAVNSAVQGGAGFLGNIGQDIGALAKTVGGGALYPAFMSASQNVPQAQIDPLVRAAQMAQAIPQAAATGGTNLINAANKNFPVTSTGAQGFADALIKNGVQGGLASVGNPAGLIGQGFTYGAEQSDPGSAMIGAPLGAAFGMTLKAIPGLGAHLFNEAANFAEPAISKLLGKTLSTDTQEANQAALANSSANYKILKGDEKSKWNNFNSLAQQSDEANPSSFNSTPYTNYLDNRIGNLQNQIAKEPVKEADLTPVIGQLNALKNGSFNSISDAANHMKTLNNLYGTKILPNTNVLVTPAMKSELQQAHGVFRNLMANNLSQPGLEPVQQAFQDANAATIARSNFDSTLNNAGNVVKSKFAKLLNLPATTQAADVTAKANQFVNNYIPSMKDPSVGKMQQFVNMVGDPQVAQNALKANLFSSARRGDNIDVNAALNRYNYLSGQQKNIVFSPLEQQHFDALNTIKNSEDNLQGTSAVAHIAPALIGALFGRHFGANAFEGGAGGLVASKMAGRLASNLSAHPTVRQIMVNRLTNQAQTPPLVNGLAKALGLVGRTAGLPTAINTALPTAINYRNSVYGNQ